MKQVDVIIIGGGPGGLAAAAGARQAGADSVLVLEREDKSGGILNQCIHDGFGLVRYKSMLTGPEYARKARQEALDAGAQILTRAMVTGLTRDRVVTAVTRQGSSGPGPGRWCWPPAAGSAPGEPSPSPAPVQQESTPPGPPRTS